MQLFDSPFSPFARKVRLVLEWKDLDFESVDVLAPENAERLREVNPRQEVPALVDDDVVVVNSADIVSYLDHRYPARPVLPSDPALRVEARRWERISDTLVDAVLVDISYWQWAEREDEMPAGMLQAAREDLATVYAALDQALSEADFVCGEMSIAELALFPHLAAASTLGVPFSAEAHPNVVAWFSRLRKQPIFLADLKRARDFLTGMASSRLERKKIFWRGDRIEWLLARGFEDWFFGEIEAGRTIWPPQTV